MLDVLDKLEALIPTVNTAVATLRGMHPSHTLLEWGNTFNDLTVPRNFIERFYGDQWSGKTISADDRIQMFSKYLDALRSAIKF